MNFPILSSFWVRVTEISQKIVDSSPQVDFWKMKKYLQAFDRKRVFPQSFIICIPREQVTVVSWDNLVQIHPLPGTITQVPSPNHLNKLSPEYSGRWYFTSLTENLNVENFCADFCIPPFKYPLKQNLVFWSSCVTSSGGKGRLKKTK